MDIPLNELYYKTFLTQEEAARLNGLGINKIGILVNSGKIVVLKNGGKKMIENQALREYLKDLAQRGLEI